MTQTTPKLHLVCGKAASGKSTLTAKLGQVAGTIVIAEDDWLATLFGDQMSSISDYARCAARLRDVMGPHVVSLLKAGLSVALDFPANTIAARAWMRGIAEDGHATAELHYLDVPDEICKARLRARNAGGEHPFSVTNEQFDTLSSYFVAPGPDEGFDIMHHRADDGTPNPD
ncbi:AAA family ATPase [Hoeflea prorocentri]|uniref:ATP-binding protein n=1 Tax=Hoeflea prorocentri TaxID=1922333 RepID=A0A9X3UL61_9HYPH|nr:ATP-binding protein [Hoeflea prorocentri]MCY6382659.1 ATP-binding protein [Hoeflea prorocentri]MDA5400459.1 ATP-binding protein [Hoeflea prorocentri]